MPDAEIEVVVHVDRGLGIHLSKLLPRGARLRELKQMLADEDPTGQVRTEDIVLVRAQGTGGEENGLKPLGDAVSLTRELKELVLLPPGQAVAAVAETRHEAALAGSGPACSEEIAVLADEALTLSEHVECRVMQPVIFKKPGRDPTTGKIVQLTKRVGATVHATGRSWKGPRGGEWVELDSLVEKPGWLLVEGPGFGMMGPLLQRIEAGDEDPLVLGAGPVVAESEDGKELRHFVVAPSSKISEAKIWISLLYNLEPMKIIIAAPLDEADENSQHFTDAQIRQGDMAGVNGRTVSMLSDDKMTMRDAGFRTGQEVFYVYAGGLEENIGEEPAWVGRARGSKMSESRPSSSLLRSCLKDILKEFPELKVPFEVLGLEPANSADDIKRCYRRLALASHPDKQRGNIEAATERFQEIKAAYEVVRDRLQL